MNKVIQDINDIEDVEQDSTIEDIYKDNDKLVTDWLSIPTISNIKEEIRSGSEKLSLQLNKINKWHSYRDGEITFKPVEGRSEFVYRLVRKQLEWQYPNLEEPFLSTNRLFEFDDSIPMHTATIIQFQNLINMQFTKEMDLSDFITKYIRKLCNDGTVIVKVTWDKKVITEEYHITSEEYGDGLYFDEVLEVYEDTTLLVSKDITVHNKPVLEFCDIENVIIDTNAKGNIEDAKYILHRFESTFSDLKEDGRYYNLGELTLEDLVSPIETEFSSSTKLDYLIEKDIHHIPNKPLIVNEYWGYYDIDNDGVAEPIIISWIGNTIVRMERNPYPLQELPFEIIQCLPNVDSNYGDSPIELIMDNQDVVSAVLRGVIDITGRKALGQRISTKNAFDNHNRQLFELGKDCEINAGYELKDNIYTQSFDELPSTVPYIINLFNDEAEALTGVKAFSQGLTGESYGQTATAVRTALDATSKRETSILRRASMGLTRLCRKVMRLDIELLSDEEIMLKSGYDSVLIDRTQYQPLFGLNINISTPEIRSAKSQQLTFLMQTIGNNMEDGERRLIMAETVQLGGMESLSKNLMEYQPQPDKFTVAMQELELAEKQAKVDKERAMATYYLAMAGTQSAEKDLKDLEFDDKFTGKDIEKEKAIESIKSASKAENK